jgi:hypothetical protein
MEIIETMDLNLPERDFGLPSIVPAKLGPAPRKTHRVVFKIEFVSHCLRINHPRLGENCDRRGAPEQM